MSQPQTRPINARVGAIASEFVRSVGESNVPSTIRGEVREWSTDQAPIMGVAKSVDLVGRDRCTLVTSSDMGYRQEQTSCSAVWIPTTTLSCRPTRSRMQVKSWQRSTEMEMAVSHPENFTRNLINRANMVLALQPNTRRKLVFPQAGRETNAKKVGPGGEVSWGGDPVDLKDAVFPVKEGQVDQEAPVDNEVRGGREFQVEKCVVVREKHRRQRKW